jgi:hypothetical protein
MDGNNLIINDNTASSKYASYGIFVLAIWRGPVIA